MLQDDFNHQEELDALEREFEGVFTSLKQPQPDKNFGALILKRAQKKIETKLIVIILLISLPIMFLVHLFWFISSLESLFIIQFVAIALVIAVLKLTGFGKAFLISIFKS